MVTIAFCAIHEKFSWIEQAAAWNIRKIASFLQKTQCFVLIIAEFWYILGDSWRIRDGIPVLDNYRRGIRGAIWRAGLVLQLPEKRKKAHFEIGCLSGVRPPHGSPTGWVVPTPGWDIPMRVGRETSENGKKSTQ